MTSVSGWLGQIQCMEGQHITMAGMDACLCGERTGANAPWRRAFRMGLRNTATGEHLTVISVEVIGRDGQKRHIPVQDLANGGCYELAG